MQGSHLLAEFFHCEGDPELLNRADRLRDFCLAKVRESGLTIVGESFYQFEPQGATGAIVLAESHFTLHTWPEHHYVSLDIFVCNYSMDNTPKAKWLYEQLRQAFAPREPICRQVERGTLPIKPERAA